RIFPGSVLAFPARCADPPRAARALSAFVDAFRLSHRDSRFDDLLVGTVIRDVRVAHRLSEGHASIGRDLGKDVADLRWRARVTRAVAARMTMRSWTIAMMLFSPSPVADALRHAFAEAKGNLIGAAEAMPDSEYAFRPTPRQMRFGMIVKHVAESN